jgi:hypothetical protein
MSATLTKMSRPEWMLEPDVVLAVRMPVPLSRVARYLRGWSKEARTKQLGDWLVVIDPAGTGMGGRSSK